MSQNSYRYFYQTPETIHLSLQCLLDLVPEELRREKTLEDKLVEVSCVEIFKKSRPSLHLGSLARLLPEYVNLPIEREEEVVFLSPAAVAHAYQLIIQREQIELPESKLVTPLKKDDHKELLEKEIKKTSHKDESIKNKVREDKKSLIRDQKKENVKEEVVSDKDISPTKKKDDSLPPSKKSTEDSQVDLSSERSELKKIDKKEIKNSSEIITPEKLSAESKALNGSDSKQDTSDKSELSSEGKKTTKKKRRSWLSALMTWLAESTEDAEEDIPSVDKVEDKKEEKVDEQIEDASSKKREDVDSSGSSFEAKKQQSPLSLLPKKDDKKDLCSGKSGELGSLREIKKSQSVSGEDKELLSAKKIESSDKIKKEEVHVKDETSQEGKSTSESTSLKPTDLTSSIRSKQEKQEDLQKPSSLESRGFPLPPKPIRTPSLKQEIPPPSHSVSTEKEVTSSSEKRSSFIAKVDPPYEGEKDKKFSLLSKEESEKDNVEITFSEKSSIKKEILVEATPESLKSRALEEIPDQESVQALFLTEEELTIDDVVERCTQLPGIRCSILARGSGVISSSHAPDQLDVMKLTSHTMKMIDAMRENMEKMGIGDIPAVTLHSAHGLLTIFPKKDICLLVMHADRNFIPGVREKLVSVVEALMRANLPLALEDTLVSQKERSSNLSDKDQELQRNEKN